MVDFVKAFICSWTLLPISLSISRGALEPISLNAPLISFARFLTLLETSFVPISLPIPFRRFIKLKDCLPNLLKLAVAFAKSPDITLPNACLSASPALRPSCFIEVKALSNLENVPRSLSIFLMLDTLRSSLPFSCNSLNLDSILFDSASRPDSSALNPTSILTFFSITLPIVSPLFLSNYNFISYFICQFICILL